jgi:hypothetical protein
MSDDIVLNKKESIERCIKQVREYYAQRTDPFEQDYRSQDAIALNLQRAAEQCIDLANHVIKEKKLGIPKESRDAFDLLAKAGIISMDIKQWLSDEFTSRAITIIRSNPDITFRQLYTAAYEKVTGSHVRMKSSGNFSIDQPVREFFNTP